MRADPPEATAAEKRPYDRYAKDTRRVYVGAPPSNYTADRAGMVRHDSDKDNLLNFQNKARQVYF